ncbi:hypothetical protein JCM11251_008013 [Rhodosporidiobolus azoricus]
MPTPRKSPASAGKKQSRRSSLLASQSSTASPLASTSKATLDSPAKSVTASAKKAKKVAGTPKKVEKEDVEPEEDEVVDGQDADKGADRFAMFLEDAGEDDEAADGEADDLDLEDGNDAGEADDRFSSFPTEDSAADETPLTEKELLSRTTLPAHLLPRSLASSKGGKVKTPGLIYLSRIPPGMGPGKVKHLLGQFGEVGRIYLARADAGKEVSAAKRAKQRERHQSHNFKEGWVEFMDKRVARSVAEMLNAQTIGGKKSERWHDDIWTMRYLPRFRWDQLSDQVALERATQTSLLRFHLTHSKSEQESYLSAVERARTNSKIEEKAASRGKAPKRAREEQGGEEGGKGKRQFRQREVVDVSKKLDRSGGGGGEKQLESVLGRLF